MSSSEDALRGLIESDPGDWSDAVREIAADLGDQASKFLARVGGKAVRTGERWINKATNKINPKTGNLSQASVPKPPERAAIVAAWKLHRAAKKLRAATTVHAGRVDVFYLDDGRVQGSRIIGDLPVAGTLATAIEAAAGHVESGDFAAAAEVLDAGVLDAYGVPEGTLGIADYQSGLSFS